MTQVELVDTSAAQHFGLRDLEQHGDLVRASMTLTAAHVGPDGRPSAGALGVLVDEVLGYAIMASLPAGSWSISTEIWVDLLRPVPPVGTTVRAESGSVATGSFAVGRVLDENGEVVAECRERGRALVRPGTLASAVALPETDRPAADFSELLGLRLDAGQARAQMGVTHALTNPSTVLHGGVSLAACEQLATAGRVAAGSSLPTTSVHVVHTRPAPIGAEVVLESRTVHAGRSLWLTDVDALVEGKVCATGRVSAQV
ncbi:PaaI family thioesterase [Nocardioides halotolerans]|uniref:PaaI family thioesterase n=1 Tax=Nocardioides halotolerans TaxID=433660 RepID=UPI00040C8B3B|nr:PaaI family thioesterase [Nocardioides halotolerans]